MEDRKEKIIQETEYDSGNDNRGMSTQNVVTICVAVIAVLLVAVVVLIKTGVIGRSNEETSVYYDNVTFSRVVSQAATDENGETVTDENGSVVYYTMLDYYTKPGVTAKYTYAYTTKSTTSSSSTTEIVYYIQYTNVEDETDADGNAVTDANGEKVTKVVTVTKKTDKEGNVVENGTTAAPTTVTVSEQTTSIVYESNIFGKTKKDIHGNPVTSEVLTEAPTTTTTAPVVQSSVKGGTTTKKATTTTKKTTTKASTTKTTAPSTEDPAETTVTESVTQPSTES